MSGRMKLRSVILPVALLLGGCATFSKPQCDIHADIVSDKCYAVQIDVRRELPWYGISNRQMRNRVAQRMKELN